MTLRFFTESQTDSCDCDNSRNALTCTTSSIPFTSYSFDIKDLFGGNGSSGFVDQIKNVASSVSYVGDVGIRWQLLNKENFSRDANYSSMLYQQYVANPSSDAQKPGNSAPHRGITVYVGKNCSENDPNDKSIAGLFPEYYLNCLTDEKGSCGTTPFKIASFNRQKWSSEEESCCVFSK